MFLSPGSQPVGLKRAALRRVVSQGFGGYEVKVWQPSTAADRDVSETRIMDVTRHKDTRTVRGNIHRANLFKGHAGASFL